MVELHVGSPLTTGFLLLLVLSVVVLFYSHRAPSLQRLPGPRGVPFLGNTFQIPSKHFATYLKDLHSRHGGLVYLNINRQNVFSFGDVELATELLERRSSIYSSRPANPFLERYGDPEGVRWGFAQLGESHYWGRKLSTSVMKHVRAGHTEPLQRLAGVALVRTLLQDNRKDWYEQINRMSASLSLAAMFGVDSITREAPEVGKMVELMDAAVAIIDPFCTIMNILPIIDDLIPAFIQTPWRALGEKSTKHDAEGWNQLFREALEGNGAHMSTWASMFAEEGKDRQHQLTEFAIASVETTSSALHGFVLACIVFPKWIEMAQQELDRVVGKDRLPRFQDRPSLPFIEAVVRELLRWNPPVRTGIAHMTTADDVVEYRGNKYFIPKGSTIFCPAYVMEHDASRYDKPQIFRPQRFLDEKGQLKSDYRTTTFGFGRRMCVGVPFAERSLWIVIATVLWTFNIKKDVHPSTGLPFEYSVSDDAFDWRLTSGPLTFPARFEPRDANRVAVARREWDDCEKDLNILLPPLKS